MNFKKYLFILIIGISTLAINSCGSSVPLTDDQLIYVGHWEAPGDISISIAADGGADFKLSNTSVTGGNITFADNSFKIGLFGIENDFSIDKAPYEEEGVTYMVAGGVKYKKNEY